MSYRREPRVSNDTWILVADRAKATVYKSTWPEIEQMEAVHTLESSNGAAHASDVWTDQRGHFGSPVHDKQTGDPQTDFRHQTANAFGVELVDLLEKGRVENQFGRMIVVAPPLLLGVLRDRMSAPLAKTLVVDIDKELVDAGTDEILSQVRDALSEAVGRDS